MYLIGVCFLNFLFRFYTHHLSLLCWMKVLGYLLEGRQKETGVWHSMTDQGSIALRCVCMATHPCKCVCLGWQFPVSAFALLKQKELA